MRAVALKDDYYENGGKEILSYLESGEAKEDNNE